VTRFLDFARPLHADTETQSITAVVDRALGDVGTLWKGGKIQVMKEYEANLPLVPLDESLSEQAFVNLIQNAYDAMGDEGGSLRVHVAKAMANGRAGVEVRIEDTGPGIPAELREQIFNPFVTTKKTGVGLGLSIVSKIMDGHGGFVHIEEPTMKRTGTDAGACFVLFFPAEQTGAEKRASELVIS